MITDLLGTTLPRLSAPFFRDVIWRGPPHSTGGAPCLYLTFDDGPHPESTPLLLDLLREERASATFFVLGSQAEQFPQLVRATAEAGHRIGNHGWTHKSAWRTKTEQTLREFERSERLAQDLSGQGVQHVRPPYGRFTPALLRWCKKRERLLTLWDIMPGDFLKSKPPEVSLAQRVSDRIENRTRPGSIVVLHDGPRSLEVLLPALRKTLPMFVAEGWSLASL